MHLIIGGAYQGKLSLAVREYGLSQDELFDLADGLPRPGFRCFYHLEELTRKASAEGLSSEETAALFIPFEREAVIVSREVCCGVVPMDADERAWREKHGGVLRILAQRAQSVTRVFCGIGVKIK